MKTYSKIELLSVIEKSQYRLDFIRESNEKFINNYPKFFKLLNKYNMIYEGISNESELIVDNYTNPQIDGDIQYKLVINVKSVDASLNTNLKLVAEFEKVIGYNILFITNQIVIWYEQRFDEL